MPGEKNEAGASLAATLEFEKWTFTPAETLPTPPLRFSASGEVQSDTVCRLTRNIQLLRNCPQIIYKTAPPATTPAERTRHVPNANRKDCVDRSWSASESLAFATVCLELSYISGVLFISTSVLDSALPNRDSASETKVSRERAKRCFTCEKML